MRKTESPVVRAEMKRRDRRKDGETGETERCCGMRTNRKPERMLEEWSYE